MLEPKKPGENELPTDPAQPNSGATKPVDQKDMQIDDSGEDTQPQPEG